MKPYYEEPNAVLYQGHALDILKGLPSESVDCAMCSPPYWGLRTYKTEPQIWGDNHCEHDFSLLAQPRRQRKESDVVNLDSKQATVRGSSYDANGSQFCLKCKAWRGELGLEPTIELYISHLLQIFNEAKRVLKKTGTCWVVIDDSYASGKGTCFNPGGGKGSFSGHGDRKDAGAYPLDRGNTSMLKAQGVLPKSLCLIPGRFALAMVDQGWILRNDIVWAKPNPMPESVKDRFTGSWEHLFFFVKSKKYWFEQQFEAAEMWGTRDRSNMRGGTEDPMLKHHGLEKDTSPLGRNKRDVWEICTEPSPIRGVHFATYPEKLVETPILAGCPAQICKRCRKARERIYERTGHVNKREPAHQPGNTPTKVDSTDWGPAERPTTKYTDCGCNDGFEAGVVLDIFAGSGTTGAVAKRLGRKYIGIELSEEYCRLHIKRLQAVPLAMELAMTRGVTNG